MRTETQDCLAKTEMFHHLIMTDNLMLNIYTEANAVPLHATEVFGWRGGVAPTHSRPQHYTGVSGQCHALATL
jgi:hypothetical protein